LDGKLKLKSGKLGFGKLEKSANPLLPLPPPPPPPPPPEL
jgi:hypothetical protein